MRAILKRLLTSAPVMASFGIATAVAAALLIVYGRGGGSIGRADAQSISLDLSKYELTFDENFDTLDVSAWGPGTRWIAHTPWNGDFGDAQFVDPKPGFPFTVENGILRIEARRGDDGKWRSGLLASSDPSGSGYLQQFGYFEMRAKLPQGPGLWPAFWLVANKDADTSAEVDVVEHYGKFPESYESAVHVFQKTPRGRHYDTVLRAQVPPGSLYEDFHLYGASIDADWIIFYLDRREVGRTPAPPEHKHPMFILLDLGMGAGWPIDQTPNPSFMFVDYVRAYRKLANQ
jgi:beta-glucanase (GH16 family)